MISGMKITALRRADIPELSQFLIGGFGVPASTTCFSHEVLGWKYFDGPGGPSEDSTCSLVARLAGRIIGHIGLCPRQFIVSGNEETPVSTMHAIDWLGSAAHSGSGALLMLQAFATCKTQYAVGGSALAQAVFPRLGFEQKSNLAIFRKVLAPFHRLRTTDQGFFRKWAGTAKDLATVWRTRTRRPRQTVELRPAPAFTKEIDCLLRQSSSRIVTSQRDHLLLNYFLRYPLSGVSGWTIHKSQQLIGFALLKVTPDGRILLGKIVDCWLNTEDPSCWQAAVAALIDRLRALAADTVTCYATTPNLHAALLWNGFINSGERNVYVRDKQQSLPRDLPFGFSMLEADLAIH
ncbi:MAG: putative acetyltransferase [Planctomycetaceae bacterium]|nr:putative acetyltransferase [Planctomycetaceae bacterium]